MEQREDVPAAQRATGDPRVDGALSRLDDLAGLPVAEHPAVFEQVHQRLAEALGDLDAAGPGEAPDDPGESPGPGNAPDDPPEAAGPGGAPGDDSGAAGEPAG
ncbi:MAG: hypothetical protein LBI49_10905 [Nocardiopsaceae bacterium]|nr:hypothetical protein [Nocardiopsaceae bacterium]